MTENKEQKEEKNPELKEDEKLEKVMNDINLYLSTIHEEMNTIVDNNFMIKLEDKVRVIFEKYNADFKQNIVLHEGTPAQIWISQENNQIALNILLNTNLFSISKKIEIDQKLHDQLKRYHFIWYELLRMVQASSLNSNRPEWQKCLKDVEKTMKNFMKNYLGIDIDKQIEMQARERLREIQEKKEQEKRKYKGKIVGEKTGED